MLNLVAALILIICAAAILRDAGELFVAWYSGWDIEQFGEGDASPFRLLWIRIISISILIVGIALIWMQAI